LLQLEVITAFVWINYHLLNSIKRRGYQLFSAHVPPAEKNKTRLPPCKL